MPGISTNSEDVEASKHEQDLQHNRSRPFEPSVGLPFPPRKSLL